MGRAETWHLWFRPDLPWWQSRHGASRDALPVGGPDLGGTAPAVGGCSTGSPPGTAALLSPGRAELLLPPAQALPSPLKPPLLRLGLGGPWAEHPEHGVGGGLWDPRHARDPAQLPALLWGCGCDRTEPLPAQGACPGDLFFFLSLFFFFQGLVNSVLSEFPPSALRKR